MATKKLQIIDSLISTDTTLSNSGQAADAKAVSDALANKSDSGHTHDDIYYTESEVDTKISSSVSAEQARAEGIESGLRTDVDAIKNNSVYATDSNKDGNVELIFGIKPNPIFTITDVYGIGEPFNTYGDPLTFEFESGMTWEEWINSKYNPEYSQVNFDGDYVRISWGYVLRPDYNNAMRNDLIIANMQYKASN